MKDVTVGEGAIKRGKSSREQKRELEELELDAGLTESLGERGSAYQLVRVGDYPLIAVRASPPVKDVRKFLISDAGNVRELVLPRVLSPSLAMFKKLVNECPLIEVECAIAIVEMHGVSISDGPSALEHDVAEATKYFSRYAKLYSMLPRIFARVRPLPDPLRELLRLYRGAEIGEAHTAVIRSVFRLLERATSEALDWNGFVAELRANGIVEISGAASSIELRAMAIYQEARRNWTLEVRPGWARSAKKLLEALGVPVVMSDEQLRSLRAEVRRGPRRPPKRKPRSRPFSAARPDTPRA